MKHTWLFILLFLGIAYGLPALKIVIPSYILISFMIFTILISIFSIKYILKFNQYREMYKQVLLWNPYKPGKTAHYIPCPALLLHGFCLRPLSPLCRWQQQHICSNQIILQLIFQEDRQVSGDATGQGP